MRLRLLWAIITACFLSACASALAPTPNTEPFALREGSYSLDQNHASLLFKIRHLGISDYVGRFNSFNASLEFDPDNPKQSKLDAIIDVTSLDVNNPSFAKTLKGPRWFDTSNHPQARFTATEIIIDDEMTGRAIGDLTIRGITKPATIKIAFNGGLRNSLNAGRYTIGFDGETSFKRSEFGIDRFTTFVSDEVRLEFSGEFVRQ